MCVSVDSGVGVSLCRECRGGVGIWMLVSKCLEPGLKACVAPLVQYNIYKQREGKAGRC